MTGPADIAPLSLALGYLMLLLPLSVALAYRLGMAGDILVAALRMSVQLLFVGFYLQVVFKLDQWWLTALWLFMMVAVADVTILRRCELRVRRFALPLFGAVVVGTLLPLTYMLVAILRLDQPLSPVYVIPISGMILGNCLRANVIGLSRFYQSLRQGEGAYLWALSQGATRHEAGLPYLRQALRDAFSPTVATMATIGLVALPGMMTGILLGGADPMSAIKYQIAIMIAILTGTVSTLVLGVWLSVPVAFTKWGTLDESIFRKVR